MRTIGSILCLSVLLAGQLRLQEPSAFTKPGQQERYQRLEMLAAVVVDWHCSVADANDQQRNLLTKDLERRTLAQARQASFREENYTIAAFASTRPNAGRVLTEGRAWKPGPSGWEKTVQATLTEKQNEAVAATLVRRRVNQVESAAAAHAAYVHHLVGLSSDKGPAFRKHLLNQFGADLLAQPLCTSTLPRFRLLDDTVLSRMLADRGEGVRRLLRGQTIDGALEYRISLDVWVRSGSEEKKLKAIESAVNEATKQAASAHGSTVSVIASRYKLSEKQRRKLELAAKGVRSHVVSNWKRQLSQQYDRTASQWGRVIGAVGSDKVSTQVALKVPALRDDRIWRRTLERLARESTALRGHSELVRRGLVQQQLVIFDAELWLLPNQREAFAELLAVAVENEPPAVSIEQLSAQVTATAKRLPDKAVDELLTPNQLKVLTFLREPKPIQ